MSDERDEGALRRAGAAFGAQDGRMSASMGAPPPLPRSARSRPPEGQSTAQGAPADGGAGAQWWHGAPAAPCGRRAGCGVCRA